MAQGSQKNRGSARARGSTSTMHRSFSPPSEPQAGCGRGALPCPRRVRGVAAGPTAETEAADDGATAQISDRRRPRTPCRRLPARHQVSGEMPQGSLGTSAGARSRPGSSRRSSYSARSPTPSWSSGSVSECTRSPRQGPAWTSPNARSLHGASTKRAPGSSACPRPSCGATSPGSTRSGGPSSGTASLSTDPRPSPNSRRGPESRARVGWEGGGDGWSPASSIRQGPLVR